MNTVTDIEDMVKHSNKRAYIDIKDAQWMCRGAKVNHVDINKLSPLQFVVYQFGVFIAKLLQHSLDVPEVNLLLASELPPNDYTKNAFRNSFFYEHARKMLYIRQERMDSVGDFVVLLVHCLAHIKVGDLTDDGNVLFLRSFYKGLKVCCQEMFFSRTRTPSGYSWETCASPLEQAFQHMKRPLDKLNMVKQLIDVRVTRPVEQDFTQQGFTERFAKYNRSIDQAKLREQLRATGDKVREEKSVSNGGYTSRRLEQLQGSGVGTKKQPVRKTLSRTLSMNPDRLASLQIEELYDKVDTLNMELTNVLKSSANLSLNIRQLQQSNASEEFLEKRTKQWNELDVRRNNILKKLNILEEDIRRKQKEMSTSSS